MNGKDRDREKASVQKQLLYSCWHFCERFFIPKNWKQPNNGHWHLPAYTHAHNDITSIGVPYIEIMHAIYRCASQPNENQMEISIRRFHFHMLAASIHMSNDRHALTWRMQKPIHSYSAYTTTSTTLVAKCQWRYGPFAFGLTFP